MTRLVLLATVLLASPALAKDREERPVRYQDRTEIDFLEGLELEGELVKPQLGLVDSRVHAHFKQLFRLRDSFAPEMKRSVDEVK